MFNYTVFSTKNNHYLFDGCSSNIFAIDKTLYDNHSTILQKISDESYKTDTQFTDQYQEVLEALSEGYLIPNSDSPLEYWFDENEYLEKLDEEAFHLMIGVTEKCNMRCRYCVYGGHYANERIHSSKNMEPSTLVSIVEKFCKLSKSSKKIINFYGGEPFVNFESIQKATEFINEIDPTIPIYITTNGTLLNDVVGKWFCENQNVMLYVSIAGIPKRHDQLRVLANGNPSFDIIRNNLLKIKENSPDSYRNRITFVFNLFDEYQLLELQRFWETDEMFDGIVQQPEITFIDCIDDDGTIEKMGQEISGEYMMESNPFEVYIENLRKRNLNNLIVQYYDSKYLHIHRRMTREGNIITGVCRPFIHKIYVDCDQNLHVCENFTYGTAFGRFEGQIPKDVTQKLLYEYKEIRNKTCKNCWASKMCSLCFRDVFNRDGSYNEEHSYKLCESVKAGLVEAITEYCTIMEEDPSLLSHLDDYIIHV